MFVSYLHGTKGNIPIVTPPGTKSGLCKIKCEGKKVVGKLPLVFLNIHILLYILKPEIVLDQSGDYNAFFFPQNLWDEKYRGGKESVKSWTRFRLYFMNHDCGKKGTFLKQKSAAPLIVSNTGGSFYGRFVYGSKMKLVSTGNTIDSPAMYTGFRLRSTNATLPRPNLPTDLSQIWNGIPKVKNILILLNNILEKLNFFHTLF